MLYKISGAFEGQIWTIYAEDRPTADRMATMLLKEGYTDVTITEFPDA